MQVKTGEDRVTFRVYDVEPSKVLLPTCKTREGIDKLLMALNEGRGQTAPIPILSCSAYNSNCVDGNYCHPLFAAVHHAFCDHRPLVFSPDMIWICILQGFAIHVSNHSEKLRHLLVKHQGKEEIRIMVTGVFDSSPESAWDEVIHGFGDALSSRLGPTYDNLVNRFSTTGEIELLVSEIALMDVFQPYYEYIATCVCGIPEITLEGRSEDWAALREKIEFLAPYDLDWWLPHLRRIADQFHRASTGDIDTLFWKNIYKLEQAYGATKMNGWIAKLVPYIKHYETGRYTERNPCLEFSDYLVEKSRTMFDVEGITSDVLPSGLSCVPFKLECADRVTEMEVLGGFVGFEQNEETLALRPKLGWAVRKASEGEALFRSPPAGAEVAPPLPGAEMQAEIKRLFPKSGFFGDKVSPEFVQFYSQCDGIVYGGGRFRPLRLVQETRLIPTSDLTEEQKRQFEEQCQSLRGLRIYDAADGGYAILVCGFHGFYISYVHANGKADYIGDSLEQFVKKILGED